jgi:hypothetical protein
MVGRKSHCNCSTRFRPIMYAESTPVLSITCVTKVARLARRIFEAARHVGMPKSGVVRPDHAILLRHARHPSVPFHGGFVVAWMRTTASGFR